MPDDLADLEGEFRLSLVRSTISRLRAQRDMTESRLEELLKKEKEVTEKLNSQRDAITILNEKIAEEEQKEKDLLYQLSGATRQELPKATVVREEKI